MFASETATLLTTQSAEAPFDDSTHLPSIPVGIDDGYAFTKLAFGDGRLIAIPSQAQVGQSRVSWLRHAEPLIFEYETDGTVYSVGDVEATPTRFEGYASSGLNRAIVQHALQCADLDGALISAVSGLPVSAFYRNAGEHRTAAINAKRENLLVPVHPKNGAVMAEVVDHQVLPEALAAWYDHVIVVDKDGARIDEDRLTRPIAVVDIGGRTTDTVVIRNKGILHSSSGSAEIGLLDVKQRLSDALERRFDLQSLNDRLLTQALETERIRLFGRDYDVSQEVRSAKQELIERLHSEVRRQLGSGMELDQVLIVGGGALALADHIQNWFPNQLIAPQPAFANARGMLKYLVHVCADERES